MIKIGKKQLFKFIKIGFPLFLLVLAVFEIRKSVIGIDVNLLQAEVSQLHLWKISLILIFSLCAITPMFMYDIILIKLLGIQMKARKLIRHSFIANTFSNVIGFGGLVGLMLRNYFYSKYKVEKEGILKNIASVTLFYLTGISILSWMIPISYRNFPLLSETKWLFFAVIAVSLYAPVFYIYLLFFKQKKERFVNNNKNCPKAHWSVSV